MTLPADPPKMPKWPFLVGDVALLGLAWYIAHTSPTPFTGGPLIAVVSCVVVGAVLVAYPFVVEYTRAQEIALDDRQRALETLSRTVATSAEQISIAANGLHELVELAQRNLKVAEHLPQKIQEKIAAVSAGFEDARADEREELEREVALLRAAESDQLATAADKIARAVADLSKLEAAAQKHLTDSAEAIARAAGSLAPLDAKIAATVERAERALEATARSDANPRRGRAVNLSADTSLASEPAVPPIPDSANASLPVSNSLPTAGFSSAASGSEPPAAGPAIAHPDPAAPAPEMTEVPRTTESLISADPFTAAIVSVLDPKSASDASAPSSPSFPTAEANGAQAGSALPITRPEVLAAPEPAPIPAQTITEITPVAPRDGASMSPILLPADSTLFKPERKRTPRKPKSAPPPIASADSSPPAPSAQAEFPGPAAATVLPPSAAPSESGTPSTETPETARSNPEAAELKSDGPADPVESAISSDGATRLLVTAYIGIGNRLFIRGEGAGLSWDKGEPLQFVSIGKWRWENHEVAVPVAFKLYKNDSIECTALALHSLEPGRQHEVSAKF